MQLTTYTLTALFASSALAQEMVKTHVVRVGSLSGDLTFSPSVLTAGAGDMVQFQFAPKNHTVTQSTFDQPCQPSALNSNVTGIYSGYIPVAADAVNTATWTVKLNDTKPLWLYCSQGKHCQGGMVMVVNPPAANASRTFESFKALAALSTVNLPGDAVAGGNGGSGTPAPSGGVVDTSPAPSGTIGGADPSGTADAGVPLVSNNSAAGMGVQMGLGSVLGLVVALFV